MDNLLNIQLRAFNPELKHDRAYNLMLGKDLFGSLYVTIVFGRYKAGGTRRTLTQEAYGFIDQRLKRWLSSPKRIGCPYRLLSLDEREDILASISRNVIGRFSPADENLDTQL